MDNLFAMRGSPVSCCLWFLLNGLWDFEEECVLNENDVPVYCTLFADPTHNLNTSVLLMTDSEWYADEPHC